MTRVGLISDTHGLLRPVALAFLEGCDHVLHAGDICDPAVLEALGRIAPVTAVRGNNDHGDWADALPHTIDVTFDGVGVRMVHDIADLDADLPADVRVVITGHSHKPAIVERDGRVFVNPGSAGPRRFRLPISIGELRIADGRVVPRLVGLGAN